MNPMRGHFLAGVALTALPAAGALGLACVPGPDHLGTLAIALLLGLVVRAFFPVPKEWFGGIGFSARTLLRLGIILLGVRLNLALVAQAGPKILLLDATVITAGLVGINWLGSRLGLDPVIACLIAVNSSICGGSAVAAAAPTLRARDEDVALVIPLCSLIGTAAMLGYTFVQHHWALTPIHYGLLTGSTLHEVAHVMAAVAPFPDAAEIGTVTKLTRVVLLVPTIFILGRIFNRRRNVGVGGAEGVAVGGDEEVAPVVPKPWFVLGFLLVGVAATLAPKVFPEDRDVLAAINGRMLTAATFLMAMAMAGMGLQVDFARLRANGLRAIGTALLGWVMLATLAVAEIWLLAV
ncbi:MAG: putative sulfate exporter family transporter [Opitutaceae bacterium]|jgi:uncharacterized integral membrane protein (TIGR00698 family)